MSDVREALHRAANALDEEPPPAPAASRRRLGWRIAATALLVVVTVVLFGAALLLKAEVDPAYTPPFRTPAPTALEALPGEVDVVSYARLQEFLLTRPPDQVPDLDRLSELRGSLEMRGVVLGVQMEIDGQRGELLTIEPQLASFELAGVPIRFGVASDPMPVELEVWVAQRYVSRDGVILVVTDERGDPVGILPWLL
jgi:hypothetical protein